MTSIVFEPWGNGRLLPKPWVQKERLAHYPLLNLDNSTYTGNKQIPLTHGNIVPSLKGSIYLNAWAFALTTYKRQSRA